MRTDRSGAPDSAAANLLFPAETFESHAAASGALSPGVSGSRHYHPLSPTLDIALRGPPLTRASGSSGIGLPLIFQAVLELSRSALQP